MLGSNLTGMGFRQQNLTLRKQLEQKENEKSQTKEEIKEILNDNINKPQETNVENFDLSMEDALNLQVNQNLGSISNFSVNTNIKKSSAEAAPKLQINYNQTVSNFTMEKIELANTENNQNTTNENLKMGIYHNHTISNFSMELPNVENEQNIIKENLNLGMINNSNNIGNLNNFQNLENLELNGNATFESAKIEKLNDSINLSTINDIQNLDIQQSTIQNIEYSDNNISTIAKNTVLSSLNGIVENSYQLLFGEDSNFSSLNNDEIKENLTSKFSESNIAKLAYVRNEELNLLNESDLGNVTVGIAYESAKNNLLTTLPDADIMSDSLKNEVKMQIGTLSQDEIRSFQTKALGLPNMNSETYETEVANFNTEFSNATIGKSQYSLENESKTLDFKETYEQTYGVKYNEENLNNLNNAQIGLKIATETETTRTNIHNYLDNANNFEDISNGLVESAKMVSASQNDEDLTVSLQKLSNMENVSISNGEVKGDVNEIKTNVLETVDTNALNVYSSISSNTSVNNSVKLKSVNLPSGTTVNLNSRGASANDDVSNSTEVNSRGARANNDVSTNVQVNSRGASSLEPTSNNDINNVNLDDSTTQTRWTPGGYVSVAPDEPSISEQASNAYNNVAQGANDAYNNAFGNDAGEQLTAATESDMTWVDWTRLGIETVGGIATVVGAFVPVVGPAIMAGGAALSSFGGVAFEAGVELVDGLINGDIDEDKMADLGKEALTNGALFAVGAGVAKGATAIGNAVRTGASAALGAGKTASTVANIAGSVADNATDLGLSVLGDAIITGETNVTGSILAQAAGVVIPGLKDSELGQTALAKLGLNFGDSGVSSALIGKYGQQWIEKHATKKEADAITEAINIMCEKAINGEQPSVELKKEILNEIYKKYNIGEKDEWIFDNKLNEAMKFSNLDDLKSCYSTKTKYIEDNEDYQDALTEALSELNWRVEDYAKTVETETTIKNQETESLQNNKPDAETPTNKDTETTIKNQETETSVQNKTDLESEVKPNMNNNVDTSGLSDGEKYDLYSEKYPELLELFGIDDFIKAGDILENHLRNLSGTDFNNFDTTMLFREMEFAGLDTYSKGADELFDLIKNKYYPDVIEWENYAKDMMDKYKLSSSDEVYDVEQLTNDIKKMLKEDPNCLNNGDTIEDLIQYKVGNGEFDNLWYNKSEKYAKYVLDDPEIQSMLGLNKNSDILGITNNITPEQAEALAKIARNPVTKNVLNNLNQAINGTTENPYSVNASFEVGEFKFLEIQETKAGVTYYMVQDKDNNITYVSQEVYDNLIKNDSKNIDNIIKNYAEADINDITEELIGHDWTSNEKEHITNSLEQTFGEENNYSVAHNFDGTINYSVLDKDGKIVFQEDRVDLSKPLERTPSSLVDAANIPTNTNISENTGWSGTFGQSIINNYGNGDGTLDTDSMTKDWANAGGSVYNYSGTAAQNAFSAIQNGTYNSSINYGSTNTGYSEDWSWTGFDVTSAGGNAFGGGIVYNQYGQIDYKNSWFSFSGGGGSSDGVMIEPETIDSARQVKQQMSRVDRACDG